MYYHNLIEDEKEALKERQGSRLAIALIVLGFFFLWLNMKKTE